MKKRGKTKKLPIKHWSHSSLMAFLRNPLTVYTFLHYPQLVPVGINYGYLLLD